MLEMRVWADLGRNLNRCVSVAVRSGLYGLCQDWQWEDSSVRAASVTETVRGSLWHLLFSAHSNQVREIDTLCYSRCFLFVVHDKVPRNIYSNMFNKQRIQSVRIKAMSSKCDVVMQGAGLSDRRAVQSPGEASWAARLHHRWWNG